jgi:hypothetical protein
LAAVSACMHDLTIGRVGIAFSGNGLWRRREGVRMVMHLRMLGGKGRERWRCQECHVRQWQSRLPVCWDGWSVLIATVRWEVGMGRLSLMIGPFVGFKEVSRGFVVS